jgi:Ran GTPase-activating protein (RanGAP) involved in mRNA processing and transport
VRNNPENISGQPVTVNHNHFGPEGLRALLEKNPPELHMLRLADNDLGDEGVSHLAESPASDTLLEVDLAQNGLGDHAARALAGSKHLRNLLVLRLDANQISRRAAAALARSPLGKRLAVLERADQDEIPF